MTKYDRYNRSEKGQRRNAKYEGTAKAMLRKVKYDAMRRKNG
jgi:hypothetical protein